LWSIHVLNQEWDYDLARVAVEFVGSHVPGEEADQPWLTQRRLLQHAARCSYMLLNGLVTDDGIAWICHNLGNLYADQGKLAEAEQMYQRARQGKEKALGVEHTSTLRTVNNLGNLYSDQGKLAEAEQMYQRALQGYEKALGADSSMTYIPALNTIWGLGSLFECQGDRAKARIMYSKALIGYEKVVVSHDMRLGKLRDSLQALDSVTDSEVLKDLEEPVNKSQGETSRLGAERDVSKPKRYKLLKRLGLR
jgi:tetratricopeptide (TPR) repeat protein